MTTETETAAGTHVYRVYIKATPEQIWEAITSPEWTTRYGFGTATEYDLRPGGAFRVPSSEAMKAYDPNVQDLLVDGEVIEVDPPRRLVQTYRYLWSPELIEEGFTRVTYEIDAEGMFPGTSILTVTHEAANAPLSATVSAGDAENQGGGFPMILSDLKTLLETGTSLSHQ